MSEELIEVIKRIEIIEERNKCVELEKAWEVSKIRTLLICVITYIVATAYFSFANTQKHYVSAFVPVIGFFLSSLTIPVAKRIWQKYCKKDF